MTYSFTNLFSHSALAFLLCAAMPLAAKDERHEQVVKDLAYGSSLYHLFQQKKLSAITDLTVAKQRNSLQKQPEDAEILLAGLYFEYGLTDASAEIFTQLLNEETTDAIKNRIWFNLARVQYEKNNFKQAEELLTRLSNKLSARREAEKQYILTNVHLQNEQYDQAIEAASQIESENIWSAYSSYNLGISLTTPENAQTGQQWLAKLIDRTTEDDELLSLQDSARLVSGLTSLRQNQLDDAIETLAGISTSSPITNKALLATGWAWSQKSAPLKALTYWQALTEKAHTDAATQEAYLAVAYAFEQLDNKPLSTKYYELAIQSYDLTLLDMDKAIESIHQMELIDTLYRDRIVQSNSDRSFDNKLPQHLATPYLHRMFASKPFQQALLNYQELLEIHNSLTLWKNELPALELMLEERKSSFESKRPLVAQTTDFNQLEQMKQQRDALAAEVYRIKDSADFLALANEDEVDYLEQLDEIKTILSKLENQQDLSEENEKYQLMSGLLYWDISTDFPRRYWKVLHQLQLLQGALGKAEKSAASLQQAASINEIKLNDFDQRIDGQDSEIQRLEISAAQLIDQQEQLINKLATKVIEQRKLHLTQLRLSARYSLTRLYDEITTQGKAQ